MLRHTTAVKYRKSGRGDETINPPREITRHVPVRCNCCIACSRMFAWTIAKTGAKNKMDKVNADVNLPWLCVYMYYESVHNTRCILTLSVPTVNNNHGINSNDGATKHDLWTKTKKVRGWFKRLLRMKVKGFCFLSAQSRLTNTQSFVNSIESLLIRKRLLFRLRGSTIRKRLLISI